MSSSFSCIITSLCLFFDVLRVFSVHVERVTLDIQPYEEECFFEYVEESTKMVFQIQVTEGGFLDISFHDKYPNGTVTSIDKLTDDLIHRNFDRNGTYDFCISNIMSSLTTKVVNLVYVTYTEEDQKRANQIYEAKNVSMDDLVNELEQKFSVVGSEVALTVSRQEIHRIINERTNSWVLWWAVFECLMILSLTLGQVYYIKRFFEIRRIV